MRNKQQVDGGKIISYFNATIRKHNDIGGSIYNHIRTIVAFERKMPNDPVVIELVRLRDEYLELSESIVNASARVNNLICVYNTANDKGKYELATEALFNILSLTSEISTIVSDSQKIAYDLSHKIASSQFDVKTKIEKVNA